MINLLPPDIKKSIIYARASTFMVRFVIAAGIGFMAVLLVILGGLFLLRQETSSYQKAIATSEKSLKDQHETQTLGRVKEMSNSLNLVVQVLSQEVLFSELLRQTGAVMPAGTVLLDLTVDGNLTGALELKAGAVDDYAAAQVLINFQDPKNKIFDKTDLVSITCDPTRDPIYPCTVILKAQFTKDNAFMLLSNKRGTPNE